MRTLKEEEVNGKTYASIDEARAQIGTFLESVYKHPQSSSKPNSANSKPSERTQPKLCHSNQLSQPKGAVHAYFPN